MNEIPTSEASTHLPIYGFGWLINSSEIGPGLSAICGNNRSAFFAIHYIALCIISVSFIASLVVIGQIIHLKWMQSASKLDFPTRFPLYLAVADSLWGISHFTDHLYLIIVQTYPSGITVAEALSINLWFFFGYQQLMHASVSVYTYLRVVRWKRANLGKWEWKLHLACCTFLFATVLLFHFTKSFGNTGYWMAHDATTLNGQVLGVVIAMTSTFNACCTTFGYYSIKNTVNKLKISLSTFKEGNINARHHQHYHSTASKCLTTYVWVASCLYCPLSLLLWTHVLFQISLEVVEPLSSFLVAIVANSSGLANAYGYFYNEKLKRKRNKINLQICKANCIDDKAPNGNSSSSSSGSDIA